MDEFNVEQEWKNENKKNLFIIGSAILILLILGVVCYFIFKGFTPNSKKVFTTAIDTVYNTALKNIENNESKDMVGGYLKIQTNLSSNDDDTNSILEIINNLTFNYNLGMDYNSKKVHLEFDSTYKNKNLISLSIDLKDNNGYVYLKDIYDKYIKVPYEGYEKLFESNKNYDDYKIVLKNIKNAIDKSLKDEYFTTEDTTINIDKEISVKKHTLNLNQSNLNKIVNDLGKYLNNDEFITSLANIINGNKKAIKNELEKLSTIEITDNEPITISIYTKGQEFLGIEINKSLDNFKILKSDKHKYSYEIKSLDENLNGTIEMVINDNIFDLIFSFNSNDLNGSITINYTELKDITIPEIDVNKTIYYEDISEDDTNKILDNIKNNEVIEELIDRITSMLMPQLYM